MNYFSIRNCNNGIGNETDSGERGTGTECEWENDWELWTESDDDDGVARDDSASAPSAGDRFQRRTAGTARSAAPRKFD